MGAPAASGGTPAAGASAGAGDAAGVSAPAGAGGAGGTAPAAGSGGQVAGMDAGVTCKIPDALVLTDDDADGGLPPDCENIPRTIIANNCIGGICHHTANKFQAPAGQLDLMSPCVADRLINKVSMCQGIVLIDPVHPEASFLLNKLEAETPICGEPMPWTGHLPPDQVRCMDIWVHAVAKAAQP